MTAGGQLMILWTPISVGAPRRESTASHTVSATVRLRITQWFAGDVVLVHAVVSWGSRNRAVRCAAMVERGSMITIDLPAPYSVNSTRRVNWGYIAKHRKWQAEADAIVTISGQHKQNPILGQYEVKFIIDDGKCRSDPDNIIKALLDYVRVRLQLITDDSPKYIRKYSVEYGYAPEGVRMIIKAFQQSCPFVTGYRRQAFVKFLYDSHRPVTAPEIIKAIYDTKDADRHLIPIMRQEINRQLRDGWRITATGGPSSLYRLERLQSENGAG
jgi:hypothetical protein